MYDNQHFTRTPEETAAYTIKAGKYPLELAVNGFLTIIIFIIFLRNTQKINIEILIKKKYIFLKK